MSDRYEKAYKVRMRHVRITVAVQVLFALLVILLAVQAAWTGLYDTAHKVSSSTHAQVEEILEGYKSAFRSLLIPIEDKIAEDPSFDEMQAWLQSREPAFTSAVGADSYDGIALTYKGGYAHSWNYGDYTDYDPTTRPWYQEAQRAGGEVTVVAPYLSYLASDNQDAPTEISLTIAQKYSSTISFDLDLKLPRIKSILSKSDLLYGGEKNFIFNADGQILSSTDEEMFAHSVVTADSVVSQSLVDMIAKNGGTSDKLLFKHVDGKFQFVYFSSSSLGNTLCIMVPAMEIFLKDFVVVCFLCLALLGYVIYFYTRSRRSALEFIERDRRLEVIENDEQKERLYVDLDQMKFFGNDTAIRTAENMSYQALYDLIRSRIIDENELPLLDAFLSPAVVQSGTLPTYRIDKERFLMKMKDNGGLFHRKTIEMRRLFFVQDGARMLEISMLDAAESVDLLKDALDESKRLKQENEDEFNRFMGYICSAQDGVEELDIAHHTISRYYVRDGVLQKNTVDYPGMPFELFHEEDRAKAHELYDEDKLAVLCKNQSVSYAELRMKWNNAPDYHWCNVIVLGMPITAKTPFNVLILIKDTNEIKTKEMEQRLALEDAFRLAEQGSRAKGSFLSNMSHEIRTPLNAIIGYLSIAADEDCTPEKKDTCIENCRTASRHLLQIINDILDMSSIESGKLKIAHEEFDLKKEISDVTTIFYQNAKLKNVLFETHVENVTEEWVIGDQLRLNQVLMNLLSNAVKFTPEQGTVLLKVEQLRRDRQRVYMKFTVKDNGIGMSKEYMQRIFHPFEQENAGTAKKFGGSGLGLSITNNLVQMMGGKIDVRSEQNQGTTFEVTMFFDRSTVEHAAAAPSDYSHVRVLVVDDKDDECSYVKAMLKRCGVKADTVTSGEAALKRIRAREGGDYMYNLCIIDWNMPGMDGCEVTRKIRTELGEKMPIIIATAYDIAEFADKAREAGADKIISKPLFQSTLFDLLVSSFGSYTPADEKKAAKVDLTGTHVLLAEDNPMNMDIAVTILEKAGVKVDQAKNGQEAVDAFLAAAPGTYDLILMDVQMPVMDGYEATAKIRASTHAEATTIPIIAMTANAFAEDVAEALSKGMNAHIAKPISYDKLFEIMRKYRKK